MAKRPRALIVSTKGTLWRAALIIAASACILTLAPTALSVAALTARLEAVTASGAYYRGPADLPRMSLMINVDWGDEFIPPMLETLARYGVRATWFPTGKWVTKSPELARQIAAAGHELGNHGGWHGMASRMSEAELRRLITEGEQAIVEVAGHKPTLFAPPSGDLNDRTVAVAESLGYRTIMWTLDTIDWQRPKPAVIVQRVAGRAQNGALVLMHPTAPTAEALPRMIEELQAKGFTLVTVSELLGP